MVLPGVPTARAARAAAAATTATATAATPVAVIVMMLRVGGLGAVVGRPVGRLGAVVAAVVPIRGLEWIQAREGCHGPPGWPWVPDRGWARQRPGKRVGRPPRDGPPGVVGFPPRATRGPEGYCPWGTRGTVPRVLGVPPPGY